MNNYSDRQYFALLVHSISKQSWELFDEFLNRPLGAPPSPQYCLSFLFSRISFIRHELDLYCQSPDCELSSIEAQNLYCLLNNAWASLERIK